MEVARARRQRAEQRRQVDEPPGEDVHDAAFALDAAVDGNAESPLCRIARRGALLVGVMVNG